MKSLPRMETDRLALRPISPGDSAAIQSAASRRAVSDTMISIPHPYPHDEAQRFVSRQLAAWETGHAFVFVIETQIKKEFLGIIEIRDIERDHSQAELSFWLKPEAWGCGCMSEALQAIVCYAFESLDLNRLYAYHMVRNPGSGMVLRKNGFTREGVLRQRVRKWGVFEDVALCAILNENWQESENEVTAGIDNGFIQSIAEDHERQREIQTE